MPRTVTDLVGTVFNKTNRNFGPHRAYILVCVGEGQVRNKIRIRKIYSLLGPNKCYGEKLSEQGGF